MVQIRPTPNKLRLSTPGLAQVDAQLKKLGWGKQSDIWAKEANVSVATLRRFRARDNVSTDLFQAICRSLHLDWETLAEPFRPNRPNAIATELRVEREDILTRLIQRLDQGDRIIVITGITGIGKTVLSQQLSQRYLTPDSNTPDSNTPAIPTLTLNFDLPCHTTQFADVAAYSLRQFGQPVAPEELKNPQQLMKRWLDLVLTTQCWVLMDSVEQILEGDEYKGWSVFQDPLWESFFHQLIGEDHCPSQFILTSQDIPAEVELCGLRYPQRLHIEPLSGFSDAVQRQLFTRYGFTDVDSGWAYLIRIGSAYEGHPLALQVILAEIFGFHGGDVTAYWQTYGHEIEVVEAEKLMASQQETANETATDGAYPQLDRYSRSLRKAVRSRLQACLNRLASDLPDAFLLLYSAAAYREAVEETFLLSPMVRRGWSQDRAQRALDTLIDRHLLEMDKHQKLRQHNLIRSVVLSYGHLSETDPGDAPRLTPPI